MSDPDQGPDSHPTLAQLPQWPGKTVAFLATAGEGPHVIPISAPVRGGDHRILLSLKSTRGSLARLQADPRVGLLVLAEGNVAFTARGQAHIVEQPMAVAAGYAAVVIEVAEIEDHRQKEFAVESGIDRSWSDENEQRALRTRVEALGALAGQVPGGRPA